MVLLKGLLPLLLEIRYISISFYNMGTSTTFQNKSNQEQLTPTEFCFSNPSLWRRSYTGEFKKSLAGIFFDRLPGVPSEQVDEEFTCSLTEPELHSYGLGISMTMRGADYEALEGLQHSSEGLRIQRRHSGCQSSEFIRMAVEQSCSQNS